MSVVTMSGTIASGAREIGRAAASLLEIDYVDQQLLVDAARRLGVPVDVMAGHDERCSSFGQRLSHLLRGFLERSAAAGDPMTGAGGLEMLLGRTYADLSVERVEPEVTDSLYMKTITVILRELGDRGDIVVLGRGSQMILRELPGALHVLTLAPRELRVQRLAEREGVTEAEAAKRVDDSDKARGAFYHKFWKVDVSDPRLYDLAIETSHLSFEAGAELVAAAVRLRQSEAA
ncbi:MAG: cytidylate kinase-like family protein [Dehalococcoidia bacterium]